jgi:hypothetical protein
LINRSHILSDPNQQLLVNFRPEKLVTFRPESLVNFPRNMQALKAKAILANVPIQIGRDRLFLDLPDNQDAATRAWHSSVALYYKAGGIPWRLRTDDLETCFVGITFHHLKTNIRQVVKSCIAQGFSSDGEGFALRGGDVPYNPRVNKTVHLSQQQALELGNLIIEEYAFRTGVPPQRVVLHKTSIFNEEEEKGFRSAFIRACLGIMFCHLGEFVEA